MRILAVLLVMLTLPLTGYILLKIAVEYSKIIVEELRRFNVIKN